MPRSSAWRKLVRACVDLFVACATAYLALLAWMMATEPYLFSRAYARGGASRTLLVLCADTLGPSGVVVLALVVAGGLLAWRTLPPLARWCRRPHRASLRGRTVWRATVVVALAIAGGAFAATRARHPHPRSPAPLAKPNVLVIVVDGLRADSVEPRVMPNVSNFAARAVRFDRAYVSRPDPHATWARLFGGHEHGASEAVPSRFARAGYETHAVYTEPSIDLAGLGFEAVHPRPTEALLAAARASLENAGLALPLVRFRAPSFDPLIVAEEVARELDRQRDNPGHPFFVAASFAATYPYILPQRYRAPFVDSAYRGPFKYDATGATAIGEPPDRAHVRALYDAAAFAVDAAVGRLLASVDDDNTIVVITSSHGNDVVATESTLAREKGISEDLTRIPLLIHAPGVRPARVPSIVRDVDVGPTLCALAKVACGEGLAGRSVAPALLGLPLAPEVAFSESTTSSARVVRSERYELLYGSLRAGGNYTLFDLVEDPARTRDVSATRPEIAVQLRDALVNASLEDPRMEERGGLLIPRATPRGRDVVWVDVEGWPTAMGDGSAALRSLAARGVTFEHAYATQLERGPRVETLLSGTDSARPRDRDEGLALGARGYRMHAFIEGRSQVGTSPAFDETKVYADDARGSLVRDLTAFLGEPSTSPRFAFVRLRADSGDVGRLEQALLALVREGRAGQGEASAIVVITGEPSSASSSTLTSDRRASFELASRMPLVLVAPGLLPAGTSVDARVRSVDVLPTLFDLFAFERPSNMTGLSFAGLARGEREPYERVITSASRDSVSIVYGRYRLVRSKRSGRADGLYDVASDPAGRTNLAKHEPEVVAELGARLVAADHGVEVPSAMPNVGVDPWSRTLRLRFVSRGVARRVSGHVVVGDGAELRSLEVLPVGVGSEAFKVRGGRIEMSFSTSPTSAVGFDLAFTPSMANVRWEFFEDERRWPGDAYFGGQLGRAMPWLAEGLGTDDARLEIDALSLPTIDPRTERGLFVVREGPFVAMRGAHVNTHREAIPP